MARIETFNIYLSGVGGQGIRLLSETILRAADHAGHPLKAVDTHGLAQRGGLVVSQIRMGHQVHSPLVPRGQADLLVSLERHEALRALYGFGRAGSVLIYYNTVWQPLDVRLGETREVSASSIGKACDQLGVRPIEVLTPDLEETRMQNMAVLARIDRDNLVPEVGTVHYYSAMKDLMDGRMLQKNLAFFDSQRTAA